MLIATFKEDPFCTVSIVFFCIFSKINKATSTRLCMLSVSANTGLRAANCRADIAHICRSCHNVLPCILLQITNYK